MRVVNPQNEPYQCRAEFHDRDAGRKLIAHGGLQGARSSACKKSRGRCVGGVVLFEHLTTCPGEFVGKVENQAAGCGELSAAAICSAHHFLDNRRAGQVSKRLDCLPG